MCAGYEQLVIKCVGDGFQPGEGKVRRVWRWDGAMHFCSGSVPRDHDVSSSLSPVAVKLAE